MRKWIAAASVALVLAMPAFADDEIAPAKLAAAQELVESAGVTQITGTADMIADAIAAQIKKMVPNIDDEALAEIHKIAREEYNAARPGMVEEITKIYARHFSESEMRDIIAFYRSPTGRRMVAEQPMITRECVQISADISSRIGKRFISYLQERANKKEKPAQ